MRICSTYIAPAISSGKVQRFFCLVSGNHDQSDKEICTPLLKPELHESSQLQDGNADWHCTKFITFQYAA